MSEEIKIKEEKKSPQKPPKPKKNWKKRLLISLIILILIGGLIFGSVYFYNNYYNKSVAQEETKPRTQTNTGTTTPRKQATPLTTKEKEIINNVIDESEIIEKIPEKYPIALRFFYFEDGKRYWQDKFIISNEGVIKSGETYITLTLHNDYIKEFEDKDFCTVIKEAKANDDLGYDTKESTSSLLWKYKKILPYKECFGLEI